MGGERLDERDVRELGALVGSDPAVALEAASEKRTKQTGPLVTFSKKVFIPLTKLCRDACGYCTFAHPPVPGEQAFMTIDEVLEVARAGAAAGCKEALFTLGDKPERRWSEAREELADLGHATTISYLASACEAVLEETGLLPHTNPGVLTEDEIALLRPVSVSQGMMLETISERLLAKGMPHWGAPDKRPEVRLATLEVAGRAAVPFTTGILIGIGETFQERVDALLAIRGSHERHGHIQEVIVQNFRAKPATLMAGHPELDPAEVALTIATARLLLPADIAVQAPPNLTPADYGRYLDAGINDWGGISPVTPDHVNPERPWPHLDELRETTESYGFTLAERVAVYRGFCDSPDKRERWLDPALRGRVLDAIDGSGLRHDDDWYSGGSQPPPPRIGITLQAVIDGAWRVPGRVVRSEVVEVLARAAAGDEIDEAEIAVLFDARAEAEELYAVADDLRRETVGDDVTYVVNRNINYTNMCYFRCGFCAFSKGPRSLNLRGEPYLLSPEEVAGRAREAWEAGATEVCLQGGIHGSFTGDDYVVYLRAVKEAVPAIHVHGFTALEIWQGAETLGVSVEDFLTRLRDAGLATLPGTVVEVLDDSIRAIICPDKITTAQWCEVHAIAHSLGLRSNATIMFGTVEGPRHWARHLIEVRRLHRSIVARGGDGLFEFVPLPFVHMAAPIYLKGASRRGPTFEEALKMHAVARVALHGDIPNIQVSWVKMGVEGSKLALQAGANDLGGTLMNENISRAAGAAHGQELSAAGMEDLVRSIGRTPRRRTTLYASVTS